jgi:hypothetical protein
VEETLSFCIGCFWIVGAVFNRDQPFNQVLFVCKIALSYPSIILGIIIGNQPDDRMN